MSLVQSDPIEVNELSCKEAARWYLNHGFRPIPWEPDNGRKKAAVSGFSYRQFVTAPLQQFENLISSWQEGVWQVGLAFAEPQGVFAIDIDSYDELNDFEEEHGRLPDETWRQTTGRADGGEHFLIRRSPLLNEWPKHGPFSSKYPHLEVKSNGFIAVPPSIHPSGRQYLWRGNAPDKPAECGVLLATYLNRRQNERSWNMGEVVSGGNGSGSTGSLDLAGILAGGIPYGMPQDNALRDVVWLLIQRGHSDGEIKSMWDTIVEKSPLTRPNEPWTNSDFERHLRGAREKLGAGTSSAALAWAAGSRVAVPAAPPPEEAAAIPPEEIDLVGAMTDALLLRHANGNVNTASTHESLPRSDLTSADFLVRMYDGYFTFSTQNRMWRHWDGVTHVPAEDANVPAIIQTFAYAYKESMREIRRATIADYVATGSTVEEAEEAYKNIWKKHRMYRDQIFNNSCQVRILHQLETKCAVSEVLFDDDKFVAPCDNGVIVWTPNGVRLESHNRARLVTRRLGPGTRYDPDATAPAFKKFLESSIPDFTQQSWLQVELGAALFGQPWKGFINFIGRTNSGKSTLLRLMQKVFGTYASPIGIDAFVEGSRGNNEFRIHELKGARLVMASEPAPGRKIDAESVKALTGGDPQKTRMPYGQYVLWQPHCTIIIGSNQPMRLETSDVAMINRIGPIAFSDAHAINPRLEEELEDELPGVLNWLIEGANRMALAGHMELPESMRVLRESMAEAVDDTLSFLREMLDAGVVAEDMAAGISKCVLTRDFYSRYQMWCASEGIRIPSGKKNFSQRIGRRYPVGRSNNSHFRGLIPGPSW